MSVGIVNGMRASIDKAGRIVVPKALRDWLGLAPGDEVEIIEDGDALRLRPVAEGQVVEVEGVRVIQGTTRIDDDWVQEMRRGLQR